MLYVGIDMSNGHATQLNAYVSRFSNIIYTEQYNTVRTCT